MMTVHGPRDNPAGGPPTVSVVVPTYNRPATLAACLGALAAQDFPRDRFEVVVVDDGSAVPPRGIVERLTVRLSIRLVEQRNGGPAAARNAGAAAARGAYLAFTDDDCLPDPGWLSALAAAAALHPDSALGGRVVNALGEGLYAAASQTLIDFLYEYYNGAEGDGRFFITSNLAVPAARFGEVGGFDVRFPLAAAEDRDFCDRWRERGNEMVYAPAAVVRHAHHLTLRSFCRQHLNYGRGAHHLHSARSRRGEPRLRLEPLRFYARLVLYPVASGAGRRAAALSLLALLSQVMYASGYALERAATGRAAR
jgi:GT2 family glycosyltransferase